MAAKSFSHFTYQDLIALGIEVEEQALFKTVTIKHKEPTAWLLQTLAIGREIPHETEKAKSELIVVPILMELCSVNDYKFRIFSGYNFEVDKEKGLKGHCDFLLNKSRNVPYINAPVFAVIEAKKGDFEAGVPQLIAQLHAAHIFNTQEKKIVEALYGTVTIGASWMFVKYQNGKAYIDTQLYYTDQLPQLLGVFQHILNFYID